VVTRLRDALRALLLAGRFLTRWPFPVATDAPPTLYGHAAPFYPVIGLVLGAVLGGLAWAGQMLGLAGGSGAPALALVLLGLWTWSTGALHLDGLADCADAWVGGLGSRERTLAILKDPHIGTMGVVALLLVLLGKLTALGVLLGPGMGDAGGGAMPGVWVLLWVPVLARAQILWLALTTPAARPEGLGAVLGRHLPRRRAWLATGIASGAALLGIAAVSLPAALAAGIAAGLVLVRWRASLCRRLGGYTGDGVGALVELTETLALLGAALVLAATGAPLSGPLAGQAPVP